MESMQFDYCSASIGQFNFYKLPTHLMDCEKFKDLSLEAAVLYGLFLDRISLSVKNNWIDGQGRVYIIFPIKEIEQKLRCKRDKAIKVLNELDTKNGIGLVEKKKQGMGRPDILFIKNFLTGNEDNTAGGVQTDVRETDKNVLKESENPTPKVGKTDSTNHNITKNKITQTKNTKKTYNYIINQSNQLTDKPIDKLYSLDELKLKWDYDALSAKYGEDITDNVFNSLITVIRNPKMRYKSYDHETLKNFILKRKKEEIEYFLACLLKNDRHIEAFIPYLLNSLMNNRYTYGLSGFKSKGRAKQKNGFYFSEQRAAPESYEELVDEANNFRREKGERFKKRMENFNCSEDDINRMYEALLKEGIEKAHAVEEDVYKRMQLNIVWKYGEPELAGAVC